MRYICPSCGETDRIKKHYNPVIGHTMICDDCGCEVQEAEE